MRLPGRRPARFSGKGARLRAPNLVGPRTGVAPLSQRLVKSESPAASLSRGRRARRLLRVDPRAIAGRLSSPARDSTGNAAETTAGGWFRRGLIAWSDWLRSAMTATPASASSGNGATARSEGAAASRSRAEASSSRQAQAAAEGLPTNDAAPPEEPVHLRRA